MARPYPAWADQRLAEAYDLIYEVVQAHATSDDGLPEIKALLVEVDKADRLLAGILHGRRVALGLLTAAEALGAMPQGYCFCSRDRIGDDSKVHEPECAAMRAAIAKARGL